MSQDKKGRAGAGETNPQIAQVQEWLVGWSEQRELIGRLVRERAKHDPGYSWLTADREIMMLDGIIQRLTTIVNGLTKPTDE
jgi:hypothetical protein